MCLCKFLFNQHYNQPHFMRKLYPHKGMQDTCHWLVMYLLWQNRWLWCHSSNWFIKYISLILRSSRTFFVNEQCKDIQFAMAKMRENKYLCDMDFTQSDQCFRNKYDVNTNTSTVHDSRVMLLLSRGGHLSVYQDGNISTDLVRNFCLRTDCFRDLFTQRYSSFSTAQGEVNLPHAALERVKSDTTRVIKHHKA